MSPVGDDLASVKDDMVAFVEGHGMRRFNGYVDPEEVQSVMWKADENPDAWKDFVELAKAAAAPFLTMDSWRLEAQELDEVIARLGTSDFSSDEDVEDARWLKTYQQGVMMVFEASTEWYERFQRLLEVADDFGGMSIDEPGLDDES